MNAAGEGMSRGDVNPKAVGSGPAHGDLRTVVLRHEMPGGSWHLDWMLERATPDDRRLVTFRVGRRPDGAGVSTFEGERLADHRAAYLDYEGEVSGGRGVVTRLARGVVRWGRHDDEVLSVVVDFGTGPLWWTGRYTPGRAGQGVWAFALEHGVSAGSGDGGESGLGGGQGMW